MTANFLVVGAHPDDPDIRAGGLACAAAEAGHSVRFVSMTDGRAGHHEQHGDALVERRRAEAAAAANEAGLEEYRVLDAQDGRLRPNLERREELIRLLREFSPDIVFTHRLDDYHPDHRYTAQLVRDAAYMVTVPNVCPDVPPLAENPAFGSLYDAFDRPTPFDPDLLVPIDDETLARKYDVLDCHESQMYEWLPYNKGDLEAVPEDPSARREWLETDPITGLAEMRDAADRYRDRLVERYGTDRGPEIEYVEPFEITEYGAELPSNLRDWFDAV